MFLSASVPSRPEHERTREAASMGQLGRPTLRKTQSNLDFSKQGVDTELKGFLLKTIGFYSIMALQGV